MSCNDNPQPKSKIYLCHEKFISQPHVLYLSCADIAIGHVDECPTMHYFGIPRHTESMIAYKILNEYFWKFQLKLHRGNVVKMPYCD